MDESVFSRLFRYTAKGKNNHKENYLTEILCWLISNSQGFAEDFIVLMCDHCDNVEIKAKLLSEQIVVSNAETQVHVSGGFTDLVIYTDKVIFICEHKIDSGLSDDQLGKYRRCWKEVLAKEQKNTDYAVVLITKLEKQFGQNPDIALTWRDLFNHYVKRIDNYSGADKLLVKQLLLYLTEEGMGEQKRVELDGIQAYYKANDFEASLRSLFGEICLELDSESDEDGWKDTIKVIKDFVGEKNYDTKVRSHWGRLGIEFSDRQTWNQSPSVFAGVVLNNDDHELRDFENGKPLFVVIIDYDKNEKGEAYTNRIKLIREGLQSVDINGTGFEKEENPKNLWRLFILKKPLKTVLKLSEDGEGDYEEQKSNLMKEIKDGIDLILGCLKTKE